MEVRMQGMVCTKIEVMLEVSVRSKMTEIYGGMESRPWKCGQHQTYHYLLQDGSHGMYVYFISEVFFEKKIKIR